jgi:hemerythrin-like domain-containing protein
MSSSLIEALHDDHRNMERLLAALERQVAIFAEGGRPDYEVMEGIAEYFLDYPDHCHHPKEEALLAHLKRTCRAETSLLDALRFQHRTLRQSAQRFRRDVTAALGESDIARSLVVRAALAFIDDQRRHMALEEARFLPLAEQLLSPTESVELEREVSTRVDPMFGPLGGEPYFQYLRDQLLAWERERDDAILATPASGLTP